MEIKDKVIWMGAEMRYSPYPVNKVKVFLDGVFQTHATRCMTGSFGWVDVVAQTADGCLVGSRYPAGDPKSIYTALYQGREVWPDDSGPSVIERLRGSVTIQILD